MEVGHLTRRTFKALEKGGHIVLSHLDAPLALNKVAKKLLRLKVFSLDCC